MSYGDQVMPLDFRGMHLACLSGDNGHGKSAILDAITWALWGEARASSDELIRLGTDEMRVTFEFELGGDTYRVIKGRSKRSSGNMWEFYVASASGEWRAITGQGLRDTGKTIQRILRMDYKTFVNSAYIQQGRADEFTKQSVGDRKKILADILDLGRYDLLEAKAKARKGAADQLTVDFEREIKQTEEEISGEDGYRTQLAESKTEREALEKNIQTTESRLRELQTRHAELDSTVRQVKELEHQSLDLRREVESLLSQKTEQEQRVSRGKQMLSDRERILSGSEKLRATRDSVALLDRQLDELRALEHEKSGLEQSIGMEMQKLDLQRQSLAKEVLDLQRKIESGAFCEKEIPMLRTQVQELETLDAKRVELQAEITRQSDQLGLLKAQYAQVQKEKPELEEKLNMISEPGAKCPLCQTELAHDKHESVIADYNRQIAEVDLRIIELKKTGIEAKSKRETAQKEIENLDARLKAGLEIRKHLAQSEQVLASIVEYRKLFPEVNARLESVTSKLNSSDFAQELRARLTGVAERIAAFNYNADIHQRMKKDVADHQQFETLAIKLRAVEESLPSDEANLKSIADLISAREKSIAEARESIEKHSKQLGELPMITSEMNAVSSSLSSLRDTDRLLTGRIATLEQSIKRCEIKREDIAEKVKMLQKAKSDMGAYADLVTAFGKKGVQALIIENAIPEIQDEANRLLARMTDNAMQVTIETIRSKKTGGSAETLDIKISDEMGTRSYELYSGGEAFRVNFALRIALSKLLARRAGARLQTLIIDEGFGTQDAKGREKLVEAIDSIKDDFEKILVITHIDELKDAFPTRIEILKDENGSQIVVD